MRLQTGRGVICGFEVLFECAGSMCMQEARACEALHDRQALDGSFKAVPGPIDKTAVVGSTAPSALRANHGGNASHETNHNSLFPADGSGKMHGEIHTKSMAGQKWREAA